MFSLQDLYQEVIVDHNKSPRNFGKLDAPDFEGEGYNPLCGDQLKLYLSVENGAIKDVRFEGSGCAISTASASLMTERLKGLPLEEIEPLFEAFHSMATSDFEGGVDEATLGKLAALAGVREFPSRIKCATLCWHTLQSALHQDQQPARTE